MTKNAELNYYSHQDFICDNCQNEFQDETAYSQSPSLEKVEKYATYCFNCAEISNTRREVRKQSALISQKKKKPKDFGVPPIEASENLRSLPLDKRTLRKTNRIHQFNTSVSQEWMEKLKAISYEERLKYVEVLEKALDCYEKHHRNGINKKKEPKKKTLYGDSAKV